MEREQRQDEGPLRARLCNECIEVVLRESRHLVRGPLASKDGQRSLDHRLHIGAHHWSHHFLHLTHLLGGALAWWLLCCCSSWMHEESATRDYESYDCSNERALSTVKQ